MKNRDQKLKFLLGNRIRSLRNKKGWTQQELAEKAGINHNSLGEIERGKQNPTFGVLSRIADAFNVELMELCRFSHELQSRTDLEDEIFSIIKNSSDDELRQSILLLKAIFPFNRIE